jgi:transposase InsO family protein
MGSRADLHGSRRSPPPPTTTPSPGHRRPGRSATPPSAPSSRGSGRRTTRSMDAASSAKAARRAGHDVGRDQVARLMRNRAYAAPAGPRSASPPSPTPPDAFGPRPRQPQLHRRAPRCLVGGRFHVLLDVVGHRLRRLHHRRVYSRRLVGWKAARSMTATLVIDALNMAAWTRRHTTIDGLICHTDAGSQYTSIAYTERSTTSARHPPSAPSATVTTTRWPNR